MKLAMPILETERLVVRPFVLDDLDAIHQILDGDAFNPQPGTPPDPQSRAPRERWLRWTIQNYMELAVMAQPPYGDRAIALRAGGELVGSVGLVPAFMPFGQLGGFPPAPLGQHSPEVGLFWAVATPHQGRGYASEAARALIDYAMTEMRLQRIVATTEYDNLASIGVMRRLAMRIERNPHAEPWYLQVVGVLEAGR